MRFLVDMGLLLFRMYAQKSANSTNSGEKSPQQIQEIAELQLSVQKQHQKNKVRHDALLKEDPTISFKLQHPPQLNLDSIGPPEYQKYKLELILCLDMLLRESQMLTKIEVKHLKNVQEQNQIIEQIREKTSNTYLFLRKSLSIQDDVNFSVQDKLDKLNKMVATLKGGAQQTLKYAKGNFRTLALNNLEIVSHPFYQRAKENLQKLSMKFQDDRQKFQQQIKKCSQQKQQLQRQNSILRKDIQSSKIKIRSLQMQVATYLNKVNQLTQKLFQNSHVKKITKSTQQGAKYTGRDFQLDIKTTKEFTVNHQNHLIKRTLNELQVFLESYSVPSTLQQQLLTSTNQNIDDNNRSTQIQAEGKSAVHRSLSGKNRIVRASSGLSRNVVGDNITKVRFTRTSALISLTKGEGDLMKQGFIRTRTDSHRQ